MKVFLLPGPDSIDKYNGIGRVVHAQYEYLPKYGIEFVDSESRADIVAAHTHQFESKQIDVLHLHGIYWTGDPESGKYQRWHGKANKDILGSCRRALEITVPSYWVGEFLRRDFRISPKIVGHGINLDEWGKPTYHEDYVFWAKNRPTDVCSPMPVYKLAERLPKAGFVTTFAPVGKEVLGNLQIMGALKPEDMQEYMHHAKIYLATTNETWGITTVEAMACGVPTLGYRWGGTAELVKHKETGWLAEPGNIEGLVEGYEYIQSHWEEMSAACVEEAKKHTWDEAMQGYVKVYESALKKKQAETHKVSIVITNYNYANFIGEAIESSLKQIEPCEVVVVNDGSTDNSLEVINKYADRIKIVNQKNQGVAAARNAGIKASSGDFIISLDGDDTLDPLYVSTLLPSMKADRGLGVAYTSLKLWNGTDFRFNAWPPNFSFETMAEPTNPPSSTIPSAAMFRKSMWKRVGGYRQAYAPAEDTEFWVRGLAYGYSAAKITEDALFNYRVHGGSASHTKVYRRIDYWHPWMRDKMFPAGAPSSTVPLVRSYFNPIFTVVFKSNAQGWSLLESLLGQTSRDWEAVFVGGVCSPALLERFPFVRVMNEDKLAELSRGRMIVETTKNFLEPNELKNLENELLNGRYQDTINYKLREVITDGGTRTMCNTCGGQVSDDFLARLRAINSTSFQNQLQEVAEAMLQPTDAGMVRMKFIGDGKGASTFGGPGIVPSGLHYRGGNNPFDRFINADPRDVSWLVNSGFWSIVPAPKEVKAPAPVEELTPDIVELKDVVVEEPKAEIPIETKYRKPKVKKE